MFDIIIRRRIDPALNRIGHRLASAGITADALTLTGFGIGLGAVPALALHAFWIALGCILVNRIADGLDGAVARAALARAGPPSTADGPAVGTDRGGFLDIACDFLFYAAVPFGFALADPAANALPAAFLIFSFVGTGSSFLAFAAIAARRGLSSAPQTGLKAIHYLGGLTEGTETIALFIVICLWPGLFPWAAWIFGSLCLLTTATRFVAAMRQFR
ncbi:CDP-alcohol phosphatidyltransferase family protein [Tistrella bauzanensis]|uniref:CDP-alcohol phosphatidyltransferase family protein n=1 Tax=Tistrella arctica TaxID=3133430 RepID=A0ABU9YIE5_9PROT